ncbi:hypothetical protein ACTK78_004507, partial [Escherichia albertii]
VPRQAGKLSIVRVLNGFQPKLILLKNILNTQFTIRQLNGFKIFLDGENEVPKRRLSLFIVGADDFWRFEILAGKRQHICEVNQKARSDVRA